jgi:hypothetical protein
VCFYFVDPVSKRAFYDNIRTGEEQPVNCDVLTEKAKKKQRKLKAPQHTN